MDAVLVRLVLIGENLDKLRHLLFVNCAGAIDVKLGKALLEVGLLEGWGIVAKMVSQEVLNELTHLFLVELTTVILIILRPYLIDYPDDISVDTLAARHLSETFVTTYFDIIISNSSWPSFIN